MLDKYSIVWYIMGMVNKRRKQMTDKDLIRMCVRFTTEMRDYYKALEDNWPITQKNVVGVLDGVLQFLAPITEDDKEIMKLKAEIERLEGIEQERDDLQSQLTEYWHKEYIEEADADLLAQIRREQGIV
jgi:hypothetical protein